MKRISLIVAAALGIAATGAKADNLAMTDFGHKIKLQVNGYTGSTPLTNFPVLVRIAEYNALTDQGIPRFKYSDLTNQGGADLAFFDETGNQLASEIDTWNSSGESLVWVKLPEMAQGTQFYMCYNVNASGAWVTNPNPWGDYVGVWHLSETGTNKQISDSTTNALHGFTTVGEGVNANNGAIGRARKIAEDNNHAHGIVVDVLSDPAKKALAESLGTDFHASFWMMAQASKNENLKYGYLICRRKGDQGYSWGMQFGGDNTAGATVDYMRVHSDNGNTQNKCTSQPIGSTLKKNDGVWKKVDVVWKYATNDNVPVVDIYTNGVFVESMTVNPAVRQEDANIGIGGSTQPNPKNQEGYKGRRFYGSMDEVRLRPGVVSGDWVKADFDTINNRRFVLAERPEGPVVTWADDVDGSTGVSAIHCDSVTFSGTVQNIGSSEACEIQCMVWTKGGTEPNSWTTLTNGLTTGNSFAVAVTNLAASTDYCYALRALGDGEAESVNVSGEFTTEANLTVSWSSTAGSSGIATISSDFVISAGEVLALGNEDWCSVQYKVWVSGGAEPTDWTTLVEALARGATFRRDIQELEPETEYTYKFRAVGNNGFTTEPVSGTFTTLGHGGGGIGSEYTHLFSDDTETYWVVNGFERYLRFTVTGYTGTETLTNFPVLVDIRKKDTNGFTYDDFYHYDGSDMAFVDETGHIIPHEIDTWNKNGMTLIWVRLPTMNNGTKFTMCYRSPLLDPLPDPGNTFERYVGVWHMNEPGDGVVDIKDSTGHGLTAETHAQSLEGVNAGQMIGGNCRRVAQMPGSSATYGRVIAFDKNNLLRTGVGNVFTYSGWYKTADSAPKWAYLVGRKSEDANVGWGVQYHDNAADSLRVWGSAATKTDYRTFGVTGYSHTQWAYWTFVFSNQTFHAFLNGVELPSTRGGFNMLTPVVNDENAFFDHLCIGGQENGTGAFNGWVDEARYSKGIRSDDWIKAEYDSMRQYEVPFVTKAASVGRGVESLVPVVVWDQGARMPNTVVDVSYAYVQFAGTVTFCGSGATECRVEYLLWADGEEVPETWTPLLEHATAGTVFSIPVTGLKQDMPYNFRIRAVNVVNGQERMNRERSGSFRTTGNITTADVEGELLRLDNRFVHIYRAGSYRFVAPDYATNVEMLVVGGGGAGGYKIGGGGGGGGLYYNEAFPVETGRVYHVQVGQGGIAPSNTTTQSSFGNGQISYIARVDGEDSETMLVLVPGGGGGGSFAEGDEDVAKGADGASGGGGTWAYLGGNPTDDGLYGNKGGRGNDALSGGSIGKVAAGGGGGAGRYGLSATFDQWSAGGAGGVGFSCSITGETLFFGAGGGGGYALRQDSANFTKPGGGGSGIGGNAADVKNKTLATSGVPNTGAGGGGGSMNYGEKNKTAYWQGGNGGDGVVLISYEVHGRDPVAEEPRISMTSCEYDNENGIATITYRAYWAGIQSQLDDLYILYSKVSSNEVANGNGEWSKIAASAIGVGTTTFIPPEVGYTYWVRIVARKDANSYMYSDEIASFTLPAITLERATWKKGSPDEATVYYNLHETNDVTHLFCYWSESENALKGDLPPSGDGVNLLDLGANVGKVHSDARSFMLSAEGRFQRNKTYYFRLAAGDEQWLKFFLSDEIVAMNTSVVENPSLHINRVSWDSNIASIWMSGSTGTYDPAETEIIAIYSTDEAKIKSNNPLPLPGDEGTEQFSLMLCSLHTLDTESFAALPLSAPTPTNYWIRLVLSNATASAESYIVPKSYSNVEKIQITSGIASNTLLYIVAAVPVTTCYGDDLVSTFGVYGPTYGGQTSGWGFENRYPDEWEGDQDCEVFAYTNSWPAPAGIYQISRGTLNIKGGGQDKKHTEEGSEEEILYQYKLEYIGGVYTITNAVFKTLIADVETNYTGEAFTTNALTFTESGLRGGQHITYRYSIGGASDWLAEPTVTNAGNYTIIFKATAPSHDDQTGTFRVTVHPAELTATIGDVSMDYTGDPLVPQVVTNVSGLVRGDINPLSCSFRDEAGEWQSEPPAFTSPGEYKLYFRVAAPNHTTFITNCTVTVNGWDYRVNMDGASGYQTPIHVSDPGWLLRTTGKPSARFVDAQERYANLDEVCPNGLKLWQNYIIERSDLSKKLVATVLQRGSLVSGNSFAMHFPDIVALRNTGLSIWFRIDRKLKGESEFTRGPLSNKYEGNIPLGPTDPTGLYVFNMVLSPTNELYDGEAVLTSAATVGVLRVSSALTNTVVAVPWHSMSVETVANVDVSVSDVVNPHSVAAGDMIVSYNQSSGLFNAWTLDTKSVWDEIATVSTNGVTVEKADDAKLPRGNAFWLVRSNPSEYIYLVGRYTGDEYDIPIAGGTAENPGYTLFANPTMDEIDLNDLVFEDDLGNVVRPSTNNFITVQTTGGINRTYVRHGTKDEWGCDLPERKGRRIEFKWTPGGKIPPGTGCWFTRKESGGLNIKLRAKGE